MVSWLHRRPVGSLVGIGHSTRRPTEWSVAKTERQITGVLRRCFPPSRSYTSSHGGNRVDRRSPWYSDYIVSLLLRQSGDQSIKYMYILCYINKELSGFSPDQVAVQVHVHVSTINMQICRSSTSTTNLASW